MTIYLSGPNGMYPIRDSMADQATARSRREASSDWAGERTNRRAILFLVGIALIAMPFILVWV